jgi:hypothetical protein
MRSSAGRPVSLLILALAVALAAPARAAVIPCTLTDLRGAIDTAANNAIIEIPIGCTITLTGARDEDNNVSGDIDIIVGGNLQPGTVNLTIRGGGPLTTIIDGGAIDRVFDVFGNNLLTLTIEDLTIRNGDAFDPATAPGGHQSGGGIAVQDATLVLNRVVITGNIAGTDGGGISDNNSAITIRHSTISNNTAILGSGGGWPSVSPPTWWRIPRSATTTRASAAAGSSTTGAR